jgi:hypothetical protein
MDILKIAREYIVIYWPYVSPFLFIFASILFGIKKGYKWGRQDGENWIKSIIYSAIQIRFSYPIASNTNEKWPIKIQGTMEFSPPTPDDDKKGLPFQFKFIPDKTQWQPGPCSDPSH